MGTYSCAAHLAAKVRDCVPNAQNGAATVKIVKNLYLDDICPDCGGPVARDIEYKLKGARFTCSGFHCHKMVCDYCKAPAEFAVSFCPKT